MMSRRFDKTNHKDFLLKKIDNHHYIDNKDGSAWEQRQLYDFGWGPEYGFCRVPTPTFEELIQIVTSTNDDDNLYGAVTLLEEDYPDKLLEHIEVVLCETDISKYYKLFKALRLENPINRTFRVGSDFESIEKEHMRWKHTSELYKNRISSK